MRRGVLDGDTFGDIAMTTQNGELFVLESDTAGSMVPVELQAFEIE